MANRTDQHTEQPTPAPDLAPRANQILAEPATVENCRADYDAADDVRQTLATQEARERH